MGGVSFHFSCPGQRLQTASDRFLYWGFFPHESSSVPVSSQGLRVGTVPAPPCWVASGEALPSLGMQLKEWAWGVSELQSTYNGHAKVGQRERGKKLTLLASLSAGAKGIGLCGPAC